MFQNQNPSLSTYKSIIGINDYDLNYHPYNNLFPEDYHHANTIDYNPTRNEIMISMRNTSEIVIIDINTNTIVWKYCGAPL